MKHLCETLFTCHETILTFLGIGGVLLMFSSAAVKWLHERGFLGAFAEFLPRSVAERLQIISSWMQSRSSMGDIEAWMSANRLWKKWNACAIQKGVKYVYFENLPFGIHIKREINKEDW